MPPNLPEYAVLFHGAAWAGGTLDDGQSDLHLDELRFHSRLGGGADVHRPAFLATARDGAPRTGVREIVVVGAEAAEATPFGALLGAPMAAHAAVDLDAHVLVTAYSSGTTGLPKGVRLSHANLVANVSQMLRSSRCAPASTRSGRCRSSTSTACPC